MQNDFHNYILRSISPQEYHVVAPSLRRMMFRAGEVLDVQQHDALIFPEKGVISLAQTASDGTSIEVFSVGCEGVVGYLSTMIGSPAGQRAVVAIPGCGYRLPAATIRPLLVAGSTFSELMMEFLQLQLLEASQAALCASHHSTLQRFCTWLLRTSARAHTGCMPVTQQVIAEALGTRRVTITQCALTLREAGAIEYNRGLIEVLNRDVLLGHCCECYDVFRAQIQREESMPRAVSLAA